MNFPHGQTALPCTDRPMAGHEPVSDIGTVAVCVCDSGYAPFADYEYGVTLTP